MTNMPYEIPKNCDFTKISNIMRENECTPKLLDSAFFPFVGILINGPERVTWPADAVLNDHPPSPFGETSGPLRLMIAGLVKVKYSAAGLENAFGPSVLMVAVNQETAEVYYGKMDPPDFVPIPENIQPDFEPYLGGDEAPAESPFNLDLVYNLGIPIINAKYTVYATYGEYKSNVLTIETRVE